VINAFVKRMAIFQMHLDAPEQAGVLLLIKQMMLKYPSTRSSLMEADEDDQDHGFGNQSKIYRADINDPALSNAGQTHAIFEFLHTFNSRPQGTESHKLVKSILYSENLPNEFLGMTPL